MLLSRPEPPSLREAATGAVPSFDPSIAAELEACFGRARLLDLLAHLRDEVAGRLAAPSIERATLERDAHALVSTSGTLGFLALSQACAELCRACREGIDLAPALALTGQAARRARETIDRMLAEPA